MKVHSLRIGHWHWDQRVVRVVARERHVQVLMRLSASWLFGVAFRGAKIPVLGGGVCVYVCTHVCVSVAQWLDHNLCGALKGAKIPVLG